MVDISQVFWLPSIFWTPMLCIEGPVLWVLPIQVKKKKKKLSSLITAGAQACNWGSSNHIYSPTLDFNPEEVA